MNIVFTKTKPIRGTRKEERVSKGKETAGCVPLATSNQNASRRKAGRGRTTDSVKLEREFDRALEHFRIAHYARVAMRDLHYVAHRKRFNIPPDDWKKADRNPNARR
jgi:hypothetical protein